MTRVTVYNGAPWDSDDDQEEVYDAFLDHDAHKAVVVQTTGPQEFRIPSDEAVDIYIQGEEVDE